MAERAIPVYLFTGFLDSGKTTFIQETLEDPKFNDELKTLLILCEDGEEEYIPDKFMDKSVAIRKIDSPEKLMYQYMKLLQDTTRCEKIIIEYNGMWSLDKLYEAMPQNWMVYQEMAFFDGTTFLNYNDNMRQLVYDKMKSAETLVFNRFSRVMDKMKFHKVVRAANRRCDILYEYGPNDVEIDNIEDPLPFDLNKDVVEIEDKDYAIWYANINEEEENYYGKTLRFKGRTLIGGGLDKDEVVVGRHIMSCCVDDIQFGGLVSKWKGANELEQGGWVIIQARVEREYNKMYDSQGPVLHISSLEKSQPPEDEVATFY